MDPIIYVPVIYGYVVGDVMILPQDGQARGDDDNG